MILEVKIKRFPEIMSWATERAWLFLYSGSPNDCLLEDLSDCFLLGGGLSTRFRIMASHCRRVFVITFIGSTIFGRTPLVEWSARRTNLYLTPHNTHKRQTSMSPAGFEPTKPARELPQTHALIARQLLCFINQYMPYFNVF